MSQFIVGRKYCRTDSGFDPVTVTKRTAKTIWVCDGRHTWYMRIHHDEFGNECAVDYEVPVKYRYLMCFHAGNKLENN